MVCHIFCSSLSHVGIAVFAFIPQVPFHASHRYCQPHARAVIHSLIAFHSTHFTFRVYVFSHPANPCGCSRVPFHSTPLHHRTQKPLTVHSLLSTPFTLSVQPLLFPTLTFEQKNAPNWLPAAPSHRALRFLCLGHSLHSQRLAHNAQAEYFVPFLYTRISALLSTLAQGCFSFFGLNLLLPRQPPTTHP